MTYDAIYQAIADAVRADLYLSGELLLGGVLDIDSGLPPLSEEMTQPAIRLSGFQSTGDRRTSRKVIVKLWMRSSFSTADKDAMLNLAEAFTDHLRGHPMIQLGAYYHRPESDKGLDCVMWNARVLLSS